MVAGIVGGDVQCKDTEIGKIQSLSSWSFLPVKKGNMQQLYRKVLHNGWTSRGLQEEKARTFLNGPTSEELAQDDSAGISGQPKRRRDSKMKK